MNFSSMEYFEAVARERSFTRAAEKLHVTQQSLSAHIAGLERELGCQLLIRHIPLELTYAGEVLLRYAKHFLKEQTDLEREFCDLSQNQKGRLRVGVASTRGRTLLPRTIRAFQEEYPNIRIDLTEGSNDGLHQMLLNGEIDLAIANFPESLQGVELEEFYTEELRLYISKTLLQSICCDADMDSLVNGDFSVLSECPFVLGDVEDIDGRVGREVLRQAGIERPVVRATSHNVGTLLTLCAEGVGGCFCPENLALATLGAAELQKLASFSLGKEARCAIRFGYQSRSYQWSIIEAFMQCCRSLHGSFPKL